MQRRSLVTLLTMALASFTAGLTPNAASADEITFNKHIALRWFGNTASAVTGRARSRFVFTR